MDWSSCCTCIKNIKFKPLCGDELQSQVWRLRFNWVYTTLLGILISISYTSISSSFHQFVTNPRFDNSSDTFDVVQFGLGQSESFYSWLLAMFNFGALAGAILSGLLVQCIPYWYLFLFSLLSHIVGYILYAVTYEGWLIMISKFMSGYFLGAEVALALSYATASSTEYAALMRKLKIKVNEAVVVRVRNYLFALQTVGICIGYFLGPGAAVIFAQFEIDQFRAIAWFNVVVGVALLMLQIAAFHGESSCKKTNHCRDICHCTWKPARVKPKPLQIFISNSNGPILIYTLQNNCVDLSTSWDISVSSEMCLVKKDQALWGNYRGLLINYARGYSISGFEIYLKEETALHILITLLLFKLVLSFRFGVFETLFNPVLSDSFGFNERDSSYIFLGLALGEVLGVTILFILQKLKVSSQLIAIIGILMTILACVSFADWQAIPYDPCTEYSPFHHPEITQNLSIKRLHNETYVNLTPTKRNTEPHVLTHLHLYSSIELEFTSGLTVNLNLPLDVKLACQSVAKCECSQLSMGLYSRQCHKLSYTFDTSGNMRPMSESTRSQSAGSEHSSEVYSCEVDSTISQPPVTTCIHLYSTDYSRPMHNSSEKVLQTTITNGYIQSLQVLTNHSYYTAKMNCIHANVTNRHCQWIPSSTVTKKECEDCQPICRSREQTLSFVQYILGSSLIMAALPVLWVPAVAMLSNQVGMEYQGIFMGIFACMNSIGRSISPLFLDAAYEAIQKRTFLAMIILGGLHIPFLIEIIILYRKLGPTDNQHSQSMSKSDDAGEEEETGGLLSDDRIED